MSSREIKFRAWNIFNNYMLDHNDLLDINNVYKDMNHIDSNFEYMQYTGLKDKNGVDIYEGDIVRTDNRIFSVVYNRSNFAIKASHREKIVALLSVAQHNGCEVIGNIHESPELLENK